MNADEESFDMSFSVPQSGDQQRTVISVAFLFLLMTGFAITVAPLSLVEEWRNVSLMQAIVVGILGAVIGLIVGAICGVAQDRGMLFAGIIAACGGVVGVVLGELTLAPLYENLTAVISLFGGLWLWAALLILRDRIRGGPDAQPVTFQRRTNSGIDPAIGSEVESGSR